MYRDNPHRHDQVAVTPLAARASWAQEKTPYDADLQPREASRPIEDPLVTIKISVPTSERDRWQAIANKRGVELDQLVEESARAALK